jgi:hypothetical protein
MIDVTGALGTISGWQPLLYQMNNWNNGPVSVSFAADQETFSVRFNRDPGNIYVLDAGGALESKIPVSVSCTDPAMTFTYAQLAVVPSSTFGARYLVTGNCALSGTPSPGKAPLLVFLDATGHEVFKFEVGELDNTSNPAYVTAITSGKHAGDFAVLDAMSQLVVFRVK